MTTILPDTTLCTIVRDEIINPAGGIKKFIEETIPFVKKAVIVDTGSVDGTYELLKQAEKQYDNLNVHQTTLTEHEQLKNYCLRLAKTNWVLFLNANERISEKDFEKLRENFLKWKWSVEGFQFLLKYLLPDGSEIKQHPQYTTRLFQKIVGYCKNQRTRITSLELSLFEEHLPAPVQNAYSHVCIINYLPETSALNSEDAKHDKDVKYCLKTPFLKIYKSRVFQNSCRRILELLST
ncbi:glycosyltransferase [Candidatus Woesearchaeota archaeon]|nr:glycosyltransferase [Candidatus Woesearchaeota archaeon]